jgi:hypothetical protein
LTERDGEDRNRRRYKDKNTERYMGLRQNKEDTYGIRHTEQAGRRFVFRMYPVRISAKFEFLVVFLNVFSRMPE